MSCALALQYSTLEQIERRFAWFRRALSQVDARFDGVFPASWRVQHCLLMAFLQQTRQHILEILEGEHRNTSCALVG